MTYSSIDLPAKSQAQKSLILRKQTRIVFMRYCRAECELCAKPTEVVILDDFSYASDCRNVRILLPFSIEIMQRAWIIGHPIGFCEIHGYHKVELEATANVVEESRVLRRK